LQRQLRAGHRFGLPFLLLAVVIALGVHLAWEPTGASNETRSHLAGSDTSDAQAGDTRLISSREDAPQPSIIGVTTRTDADSRRAVRLQAIVGREVVAIGTNMRCAGECDERYLILQFRVEREPALWAFPVRDADPVLKVDDAAHFDPVTCALARAAGTPLPPANARAADRLRHANGNLLAPTVQS
jgi:hypothetical protein